ncbi:MAG: ABC transporter ATP-binding protein [Lachnospiraceae bacterium]|nr:ABC transporter ATP-binding protein [Lachnospiraceae bacterium]
MKPENVIEVKNVSINYKVYRDKSNQLKEKIIHLSRNRYEIHQVLKGISFEVKKGESIGLIGQNGCGKSTTLKLLTRILYPDSGSIELKGRVSSLLELGAGFHPDLTGRENIIMNASVFGLSAKEIDKRMDDIIAFSELGEAVDDPVRTYSSGMYMRLAFSVAINVDADILLIDEILAVGDVNFQAKCFHKLMEIKGKGTTIVLVSHAMSQIERICDRCIWLQDGMIREEGSPFDLNRDYMNYMCSNRNQGQKTLNASVPKEQEREEECEKEESEKEEKIRIRKVFVTDRLGEVKSVFFVGERLQLKLEIEALEQIDDYVIELNLVRADGLFCYGLSTRTDAIGCESWKGLKKIDVSFAAMNLLKGKYHFDLHVARGDGSTFCFQGNVADFEMETYQEERGLLYLDHEWIRE